MLSRDEAREVADIVQICRERRFDWSTVIGEAKNKQAFATEDLVYRLKTFPTAAFRTVPFQGPAPDLENLGQALRTIGRDLLAGAENTLAVDAAPDL